MIDRVYTVIHNGKEKVINVYYKSGCIRRYFPFSVRNNTVPDTVKTFMKNSYIYFPEKGIKLYKLNHD